MTTKTIPYSIRVLIMLYLIPVTLCQSALVSREANRLYHMVLSGLLLTVEVASLSSIDRLMAVAVATGSH